ncbi:MAG: NAD(P)H-binding protein [Steroidobacteraceae bacterium]
MNRRISLAALAALLCVLGLGLQSGVAEAAQGLKIVVYGGTGNIGQRIVAEALNRGHQVTVVARDPSTLTVKGNGLAVAKGDVTDSAGVARQIAGADVVISAIGGGRNGSPDQGNDLLLRTAQSLVGALRTLNPKAPRLLVVGGAGSLEVAPGVTMLDQMREQSGGPSPMLSSPAGPVAQKAALDYYRTVKDVSWTYFSPAMQISPGTRTGKFRLGGDQLVKDAQGQSRISIEDYAVAMIDEAEKPAHLRQRFTIGY